MKLSRRSFLKGIFATGAVALLKGPQILDDLTPKERDIAAEVMGLRRKQWVGVDLPPARWRWLEIPVLQADGRFGKLTIQIDDYGPSEYLVLSDIQQVQVLHALAHPAYAERGEIWSVDI